MIKEISDLLVCLDYSIYLCRQNNELWQKKRNEVANVLALDGPRAQILRPYPLK